MSNIFHRLRHLWDDLSSPGAVARRLHSQWLTQAVESSRPYPRIPLRRVSEGGFSNLSQTPDGRVLCDGWWYLAFEQVPEVEPELEPGPNDGPIADTKGKPPPADFTPPA